MKCSSAYHKINQGFIDLPQSYKYSKIKQIKILPHYQTSHEGGLCHGCFQWILDFIVDRIPLPTTEKKIQQVNLNDYPEMHDKVCFPFNNVNIFKF